MTRTTAARSDRRSRPPLWVVEGLDIVESRRRLVVAVAVLVSAVGIAVSVFAPDLLPPNALVGAAVGLAAVLLGAAAAVGVDATDLRVRGPRHVGAAGGELVAVLPVEVDGSAADELAAAVLDAREDGRPLLLGLAASGLDVATTVAWTDALAAAVARTGVSVLRVDLASGRTESPGLAEVEAGQHKLTEVVEFAPHLRLARTGVGDDQRAALTALTALPPKLPRDLDVLLVALPMAASRGVVQAARALDHVLIVAERGRTSRVDLIAGLDALDAADLQAQVILLDDRTAARLAVSPAPDEDATTIEPQRGDAIGAPGSAAASREDAEPVAAPAEPVAAAEDATPAEPAPNGSEGPIGSTAQDPEAPVSSPGDDPAPNSDEPSEEPPAPRRSDHAQAGDATEVDPSSAQGPGERPPLAARDVDVLLGAAAAAAADLAEDGHLHPTPASVPQPAPTEPTEPAPTEPGPTEPGPTELETTERGREGEPAAAELEPEEADTTDRLPRVGRGREASHDEDAGQQDLLRTTAQLAILLDDLETRDAP